MRTSNRFPARRNVTDRRTESIFKIFKSPIVSPSATISVRPPKFRMATAWELPTIPVTTMPSDGAPAGSGGGGSPGPDGGTAEPGGTGNGGGGSVADGGGGGGVPGDPDPGVLTSGTNGSALPVGPDGTTFGAVTCGTGAVTVAGAGVGAGAGAAGRGVVATTGGGA